ncbi:sensor domain-containing diguanylate cyclase [Frisingicoccus sp.]|uniref:sensor domain-containing diguanylate cyclase n=1 Tax=Frisingicoccus sp. TaxID=1918627 RepID=UPI002E7791AE|nr:diguanylate cyclase [Frisingicoccus sp.]MEE0752256.1 diguanylate cyclase [Frisingicoccus sp.]
MEQIKRFFENMDEIVYIVDMDNYEIIYMNKKLRELYGGLPMESFAGQKCYEVFQNNSEPCKICTNYKLKPDEFVEWQYYNPILNKFLMIKDSMMEENGKRYRIEIAIDISDQNRKNEMHDDYQKLEKLANEGYRLALQRSTPDECIEVILEYLGKALNGDRTYVVERNERGGDDNTYEWVANGVTAEKKNLQNLPPEVCRTWYEVFKEKKNIMIEDIEEIRDVYPVQYAVLKPQNIRSMVVFPLYEGKHIIGFYGIDNPSESSLEYVSNMLETVAHFIVAAIDRRRLMRELRDMGYRDQLTKLGNRYAMSAYIREFQDNQDIGIVYCDITGLKNLNDREGHTAGDALLVRSGECLKKVFRGYGMFRIGGDEFLILCPQIDEELLAEKVGLLRQTMQERQVTSAVGTVWKKCLKGSEIEGLVNEAENRMYIDKAAYYRTAGVDRRK